MNSPQLLLSNQVCFPVYSVSRLITKAYKPFLDKMGVTYPQYLVLMVLWENDALNINQITEKLLLNTNTLSPLLKRMEKLELLERNRSSQDERIVVIRLTKKGMQLKKQAMPIPEQLVKTLLSDSIHIDDVMQLKDMMNEWIKLLTIQEKKIN
jgi:DNA-binding MarR family transcriptional regulator